MENSVLANCCDDWAILAITNLSEWDFIAHFADANIANIALNVTILSCKTTEYCTYSKWMCRHRADRDSAVLFA